MKKFAPSMKAPLNPRARQGSSNADTKFVVKTNVTGSIRSMSPNLPSSAMASPNSMTPVMASDQVGGEILASPDLGSPVPKSPVLATTISSPLQAPVASVKRALNSAPAKIDPPSLMGASPPKSNPAAREGVPEVNSEFEQCEESKHTQIEAGTVTQHTPMDQRGKTKCKYWTKGRSPGKPKVTTMVDEDEDEQGGSTGKKAKETK